MSRVIGIPRVVDLRGATLSLHIVGAVGEEMERQFIHHSQLAADGEETGGKEASALQGLVICDALGYAIGRLIDDNPLDRLGPVFPKSPLHHGGAAMGFRTPAVP